MKHTSLPLEGIRVLDFTRVLAGPFCTMLLGDMGAEVIKIEKPPYGDDSRQFGPPFVKGESSFFLSVNRNKKSILIDLKKKEGLNIVYRLAEKSDIIVENFKPKVMDKLKLGYKHISKIKPNIIYTSISGFGVWGPLREEGGYDVLIQGMSGFMSLIGEKDGPYYKSGLSIVDLVGGLSAFLGTLLALYKREKTGEGSWVDTSLMDSILSLMTFQAGIYFATGKSPTRMGNAHPTISPYEVFKASDEDFILAVGNDQIWHKFCKVVGLHHLAKDPRFYTNSKRVENRQALYEELSCHFRKKSAKYWVDLLKAEGIPASKVNTLSEALSLEHVKVRNLILEMEHPISPIKAMGFPIGFVPPLQIQKSPPPMLGEHTDDILKNILKLSQKQIDKLKEEGVVA